eukprot:766691-Hanusia_phi.AAC.2
MSLTKTNSEEPTYHLEGSLRASADDNEHELQHGRKRPQITSQSTPTANSALLPRIRIENNQDHLSPCAVSRADCPRACHQRQIDRRLHPELKALFTCFMSMIRKMQ